MVNANQLPYTPAKWTGPTIPNRKVRVIVIHDMEAPEKGSTAEDVARYFATLGPETKASAHLCIDNNSVVRCVDDDTIAYAAPGANSDGIQLELAGYGRQTRDEWLDEFSMAVLDNAAQMIWLYCQKYSIPAVRLTDAQLLAGDRGIVGHVQVSNVYHKSDHQDPGPNFPWDYLLARVSAFATS